MRILIVEDEVTLNKTIAEGLQEFGYQADCAENFKDAEYYIGIRNYDLVLADWLLRERATFVFLFLQIKVLAYQTLEESFRQACFRQ